MKNNIPDKKPVRDKRDNYYLIQTDKKSIEEMATRMKKQIETGDYVWVDFKDSQTPYRKLMLRSEAIKNKHQFYER
jgi:hypothetical protein